MSPLLRPLRALAGFAFRTRRTVASLPAVLESILVLPAMADQLALVRRNTDALPGVLAALEAVERDTAVLPGLHEQFVLTNAGIASVQADTAALAIYLPKLVVMERSLPAMAGSLSNVEQGVAQLAGLAEPLEGAALRLGRFNDRLPGRRGVRKLGS